MTTDAMRTWLMQARPWWNKATIMGWSDNQVIRIYYKEFARGVNVPRPAAKKVTKKEEATNEQLSFSFE
jgi:hypothetical protein